MARTRIVEDATNDLPGDGKSSGEIVARAPWLTQGYPKDKANAETFWAGGWLRTGDIGTIDKEGYIEIADRPKDVSETGGERVSSIDTADQSLKHDGVAEAAVAGVPDEKWSARRMAIVVLEPDIRLTRSEVGANPRDFASGGPVSGPCGSGACGPRRGAAADQRRQDRQEGPAREIRQAALAFSATVQGDFQ
jgi:fatty-acyl-CoA synthase